jgi:hypothetical protein
VSGQEFVLVGGVASGTVVSSGGIGRSAVVDRGGTLNVLSAAP